MKSVFKRQEVVAAFSQIDHLLLALYLMALMVFLMFPIAGPDFRFLGMESDKWMHVALFGGLAMLLRWNLAQNSRPLFASVGAAFVVAAVVELAQGLLAYRSAELWDLIAGGLGAIVGATTVDRIMLSKAVQRMLGLLVVMLGLMVSVIFFLADVIGVGDTSQFGLIQFAGMALGAFIATGGVKVYIIALRDGNRFA